MRVVQITSTHVDTEAAARLVADATQSFGGCSIAGERHPHHLLVSDAADAIAALRGHGISATEVDPPLPLTSAGVHWWKCWRAALPPNVYFELRCLHHENVRSRGSLIRVTQSSEGAGSEPWRVLADGGVDTRCEFQCSLPSGPELHVLVPDGDEATAVLEAAGITAVPMDYRGPRVDQGISWWGEWKPALAYAGRVQRPILMSFASPRVEHVPGVW